MTDELSADSAPVPWKSGHRIPTALLAALNVHANRELAASAAYLSMSYWFDDLNFSGIGDYFRAQSEEERGHALKIFDFIVKRGDRAQVQAQVTPMGDWSNATEALCVEFRGGVDRGP